MVQLLHKFVQNGTIVTQIWTVVLLLYHFCQNCVTLFQSGIRYTMKQIRPKKFKFCPLWSEKCPKTSVFCCLSGTFTAKKGKNFWKGIASLKLFNQKNRKSVPQFWAKIIQTLKMSQEVTQLLKMSYSIQTTIYRNIVTQ